MQTCSTCSRLKSRLVRFVGGVVRADGQYNFSLLCGRDITVARLSATYSYLSGTAARQSSSSALICSSSAVPLLFERALP